MKMNWVKILLILAVLVGVGTRFWRITTLPFPPDGDEVAFGYYGWSLLHFGTDEYGKVLPLNFASIGDFKYPGLAYLNAIPAAIFGMKNVEIRFWDAASGVILILLLYALAVLIFSNPKMGLVASWLAALSPWSILESRLGYENHIAMVLTTGAVVALFAAFKFKNAKEIKKRRILIATAFVLFLISSFTYGAQRVFIPLFLLGLVGISFIKNSNLKVQRKVLAGFAAALGLIIFLSFIPAENRGRAGADIWSGMTSDEASHLEEIYFQAGVSPVKIAPRLTWFLHNKYEIGAVGLLDRYARYFSPQFLFFTGAMDSKERIPDMGVLLLVEVVLLPAGLLFLFKSDFKSGIIVFAWLLAAPVAASLTDGGPYIHRASIMIVPICLISAYGFLSIGNLFKGNVKKVVLAGIFVFGLLSSFYALNQIFVQKPTDRPWFKEAVNESMTKEILAIKDNYKAVAVNNDDYIFFLFYGAITPQEFLKRAVIKPVSESKWERVDRLDNIYFKMTFNCPKSGKLNVLYVCKGEEIPQNSKVVKTFYYPDGVAAYSMIEFYPLSKMPTPLPVPPSRFKYMVEVERNTKYPDGIIPDNFPSLW